MNRRRYLKILSTALILSQFGEANADSKVKNIGFLIPNSGYEDEWLGLIKKLESLGWVQGKNLNIIYKYVLNDYSKIQSLATELVHEGVNVIVIATTTVILEVMKLVKDIPIVGVGMIEPVSSQVIENISHPEGNVTGTSYLLDNVSLKLLETVRWMQPKSTQVATLINSGGKLREYLFDLFQKATPTFGFEYTNYFASNPLEIEEAFKSMSKKRIQSAIILQNPLYASQRFQIAELGIKYNIATYAQWDKLAEAGMLTSYGNDIFDAYENAAGYVDKILKGTPVSKLPLYESSVFKRVINLKTAKKLGIKITKEMQLRTDRLIK